MSYDTEIPPLDIPQDKKYLYVHQKTCTRIDSSIIHDRPKLEICANVNQ